MLSAPDAELVQRDPALPGLGILLDAERFADAVGPCFAGAAVQSAAIEYVKYRPGRYCRVGYELQIGASAVRAHAVGRPRDLSPIAATGSHSSKAYAAGESRFVLPEMALEISLFPADERLSGLAQLGDAQGREDLLRDILPGRPDLWAANFELVRYRPGRRCVGRLLVEGQCIAAIKFYSEAEYATASFNARAFESEQMLHIPRWMGDSPRHRAIVIEWLPGDLLFDLLANWESHATRVGYALGRLHSQCPPGLRRLSPTAETEPLWTAARDVQGVCPGLGERAQDLARKLSAAAEQEERADSPRCSIHGDFSPRQVLVGDWQTAILDFDDARYGDPAIDLGHFAARLQRRRLREALPASEIDGVFDALLAGYEAVCASPLPGYEMVRTLTDRGSIARHTAAALLRLAPHPFRKREDDWPRRTEELLALAETCFENV